MNPQDYSHVDVCTRALTDENVFNNFKRDSNYCSVLEHVTVTLARKYFELLKERFGSVISKINWVLIKENDSIGNPVTAEFSTELKSYVALSNYKFSPSIFRYVYTGLDIIDKYLRKVTGSTVIDLYNDNLQHHIEIDIVEIGGGYGGQAKILFDLLANTGLTIRTYTIIDLCYVSQLQNKILTKLCYDKMKYMTYDMIVNLELDTLLPHYDLLISNYGLGELRIEIIEKYLETVVKRCQHYYIIYNGRTIHSYFINDKNQSEPDKNCL